MSIVGTGGDDALVGTGGADTFILTQGGDDTASGLEGDDLFNLGAQLTAADRIRGGNGHDTVVLEGDYSAGLVLGAQTLTSVARIVLKEGFSYDLTSDNATVSAGTFLKVTGRTLAAGQSVTFDGRAETDAALRLIGGSGDDLFLLGGANVAAASHVNAGGGNDTVVLDGDYSATYSQLKLVGVETLRLTDGHPYLLSLRDSAVAAGASLTCDASALGVFNDCSLNAAAEADGGIHFVGGQGFNTLLIGHAAALADTTFDGSAGYDNLTLSGNDFTGVVLAAGLLNQVETLHLGSGAMDITTVDANVGAGQTLTVTWSGNSSGQIVDGGAETDGHFIFQLGSGKDEVTGGALSDVFDLGIIANGFGVWDQFDGFDFQSDQIKLPLHLPDSISTSSHQVNAGTLSADLNAACADVKSTQYWAELVTCSPGSGQFDGMSFLVIGNSHSTSGYHNGDFLILLSDPQNLGGLDLSDFTL